MAVQVLVAYGTKNGSTEGIARIIADTLCEQGLQAEAHPGAEVRDLSTYDAVVLGGALYWGRWDRQAAHFARRHRHRRALAGTPVWLFSSGPLDASAAEREIPPVRGVARVAGRLEARGHATFGGSLFKGARGKVARMMIDQGRDGDFRDRQQIRSWAQGVGRDLATQPAVT
ncbi:flavodoxin domain-containing protein [Streptomyces sp. H27-C3]|uniref:flavodoxin domain-containing protein n=1 Tax=Streptomyces sp. H27-C3 TaxID=3046305 RepID=UPI0024BB7C83|nr:flavodoxin domain-containing protein [Streptomyces sp. H27-C3]MDJ0465538.1 flavodoxin domain-containing protein [Streptomyces sp. H27-C3]